METRIIGKCKTCKWLVINEGAHYHLSCSKPITGQRYPHSQEWGCWYWASKTYRRKK